MAREKFRLRGREKESPISLIERNPVLRKMLEERVTIDESGDERSMGVSAISGEAAEALYRTVRNESPEVCVEIGLAFGVSALTILTALEDNGHGRLISIDPFQGYWGNAGLVAIHRAGLQHRHEFIEKKSQLALPGLVEQNLVAGLGYIDGHHTFDGAFLDFWYVDKLLRPGGVVAFNDADMPSVERVIGFVNTHRRYEEMQVLPFLPPWEPPRVGNGNDRYFRKREEWDPDWDFYEPF